MIEGGYPTHGLELIRMYQQDPDYCKTQYQIRVLKCIMYIYIITSSVQYSSKIKEGLC